MRIVLLPLVALLAVGCAASDEASGNNPNLSNCTFGDCPMVNLSTLGIEIYSAARGSQEIGTLPPADSFGNVTIETTPSVKLSGRLKLPLEAANLSFQKAALVASRPSRLPGRPDVNYQGSFAASTGAYELELVPNKEGESYSVRVTVDNTVLPPLVVNVVVTKDTVLDLVPIAPSAAPKVRGLVKSALGLPLVGIEVVGRDPVSGAVLTTRNSSDAAGQFEVLLGAPSTSGGLLLEATIDETLRLERLISTLSTSGQDDLVLQLPALPNASSQKIPLKGPSSAGGDEPIVGAQVIADVRILDVSNPEIAAIHHVSAFSDEGGIVQMALYAGENEPRQYRLDVVTLGNSEFQSERTTIEAGHSDGYLQTVYLARRPSLTGRVIDNLGRPVQGATVEPRLRGAGLGVKDESLAGLSPPSTTTDPDGKFLLLVDPGTYELAITPKVSDGLPRFWIDETTVAGTMDLQSLLVPRAARLVSLLRDQANPLANVTVRFYELPAGNALCAGDTACLRSPRLQAEATSRSDGTVEAILPASD